MSETANIIFSLSFPPPQSLHCEPSATRRAKMASTASGRCSWPTSSTSCRSACLAFASSPPSSTGELKWSCVCVCVRVATLSVSPCHPAGRWGCTRRRCASSVSPQSSWCRTSSVKTWQFTATFENETFFLPLWHNKWMSLTEWVY